MAIHPLPGTGLCDFHPCSRPFPAAPASQRKTPGDCQTCLVKHRCLAAELDGDRLAHFERNVYRLRHPFNAREVLVHQGDVMQAVYILRVGSLKAYINEPDGAERIMGFRFPGALIGLAELEQPRWLRTFVALEDSWLCRIPLRTLDDNVRHRLVKLMSEGLRQEYRSHLMLASRSGPGKLVSFLLEISDNFSSRGLSPSHLYLPMNYSEVANYLGMRHESVSRMLARLQHLDLLRKDGKTLRILDLEGLRRAQELDGTSNSRWISWRGTNSLHR
ncbi:MAG TPA: cyclic nucleotide-binding domain-containing protein [Gammaproteobacteria bacterium]|nr:cyclic nucleotide-binding domain-containing protein [Gammaproteobacteria bacterium]